MRASTIAEFFVEAKRVRVELEIGQNDIAAFRNLLPDELFALLELGDTPLAQRAPRFFAETMAIRADESPPLTGRIVSIKGRERLRRDEISGEVRPPRVGEEAETVLFVVLEYALATRPGRLTFSVSFPGAPVSVGFVAYHGAVAVNDFR